MATNETAGRPPNILVFFTDQQRADTVGCYGPQLGLTPTLDNLAAEGVRFDLAFTAQPVCGPARALLQTGVYPTVTGCFRNGIPLPNNALTIAQVLKGVGYDVGYIGKWHLAGLSNRDHQAVPPDRRGGYTDYWLGADLLEFSSQPYGGGYYAADGRFVPFRGYRVDAQTDHVLEYLRTRDGQRPFFLFVSYLEPHHQNDLRRFVAPAGYAERYADLPVPGDLLGHPEGDWAENLPDYYGICRSLDENLARVLAELERLGLAEETLVIYTSDHGCHFCTRNSEYKRSCHEASIRIPLVLRGPGFLGGQVRSELVSLVDLPPTILDAACATVPESFQGHSLQPLVRGESADWPGDVFVQISESQVGRAVRTRRWKYAVNAPGADGWAVPAAEVYEEQYLYDLEADPFEQHNLVGDPAYRAVADELAERLIQRMVAVGEARPTLLKK
ncbi:MAG: sulfatase-like hydrolase/transferase [Anaerolineales bacterium]